MPAERHLGIFALYVTFFPQLVAGPIERATNLLPQFRRPVSFNYANAVEGLRYMTWGFFKKLVVADRLAPYVETVYSRPHGYEGALFFSRRTSSPSRFTRISRPIPISHAAPHDCSDSI